MLNRTIVTLLLATLTASSQTWQARDSRLQPAGTSISSAAQWWKHTDPMGFEIEIPRGWQVETGKNGFVTVTSPDGRSFVQVIPILARRNACPELLEQSFQVPSRRFPDAHIEALQRGRDRRSALADVSFAGGSERAAVLCAETSSKSAMVYTIAAEKSAFATQRPGLIRMLTTFRYGAAATGGNGAVQGRAPRVDLQFTRWTDPREGAFSLAVPAGWQASGGVRRYTNLEIGAGVRIASPDGNTVFIINDDRLRRCMTPYAGVQRGAPAYGGGIFLDYIPARMFVRQYVQQSVLRDAGAQLTQVIRERARPDLSAAANQQFAQYNANPAGPSRAEHAEMEFTAVRNARRLAGYLLAETYFTPSPAGVGHIWGAAVFGLIAPEESMTEMMQALARVAASSQVSPQWAQSTQAAGQATQQAFHQAAQQMDQIITSSYWARQTPSPGAGGERRLSNSEKWSDMMLGQVHLTDGEGTEYTAPSGSNYYWYHGPHDLIVGKDEPTPPNIDVKQLHIIQ